MVDLLDQGGGTKPNPLLTVQHLPFCTFDSSRQRIRLA